MRTKRFLFIAATVMILAAGQLGAGVRVSPTEPTEKLVAFQVAGGKFITTNPGNSLDLSGVKIGSKQTFTLIDLNGEELADGDAVEIRYTPNSGGVPDPPKASYWLEVKEGVKRGKQGDIFKIKRVDTKYALVAPSGKFVAPPVEGGLLGVSEKQEGALLVELVDLSQGIPKKSKKSTAEAPAAPATE